MLTILLLEEVVPAVEFTVPGEAHFTQKRLAVGALYAVYVPWLVQDFHQVSLHNRLVAVRTGKWRHLCTLLHYSGHVNATLMKGKLRYIGELHLLVY